MSYLDSLMLQTGMEPGPAPVAIADTAGIVELDNTRVAPAPVHEAPVVRDAPAAPRPAAEPAAAPAVQPPAVHVLERVVAAPTARTEEPPVSEPAERARRSPEAALREILVSPRLPLDSVTSQVSPRILAPATVREQPVVQEAPPPARPSAVEQAAPTAKPQRSQPTLVEVRRWLAAGVESSAADEKPAEVRRLDAPLHAAAGTQRNGLAAPLSVSQEVQSLEAPRVELSIGSIHLVVDAPAQPPVEPAAMPAPIRSTSPAEISPAWSRLSRRYVRP